MTFSEFQERARKTAIYPNVGNNFVYPTLGLAGEAGEVANKIKKIIRDKKDASSQVFKQELKGELGDILWYVAQIATEFNLDLDAIADYNLIKLSSRMERNVVSGDGDSR